MLSQVKNKSEFQTVLENQNLSVIHFQAEWAEQCAQVNELLGALSSQEIYSSVKFYSCPAEDLPEECLKYKIEAVPTVLLFRSGNLLEMVHGADPTKITDAVNKHNSKCESQSPAKSVTIEDRLKALIKKSHIMLFMKGDRNTPRCGFSKQMIEILNDTGVVYGTFDILTDEEVRQNLKKFSDWPTYPQLYVNGELIGGLDIVKEMLGSGDLESTLNG